jgi:hypothetical protein
VTIRAAQPLGACSGSLGTASKLGKIRGPQMGSIQRPLTDTSLYLPWPTLIRDGAVHDTQGEVTRKPKFQKGHTKVVAGKRADRTRSPGMSKGDRPEHCQRAAESPHFGARNFPHLAGWRSAVCVISASVFRGSTAALDRRVRGRRLDPSIRADVLGNKIGVLTEAIA